MILFGGLSFFISRKLDVILCIVFSIFIILIAGLRDQTVGFDYTQYLAYIEYLDSIFNKSVEPSFYLLKMVLIDEMALSTISIFLVYAFLGVGLKSYSFIKFSITPTVSLLLYFQSIYFDADLAQIRQSVALGFGMLAICYLSYGYFKPVVLCLLAIFFHYSALILLLIFPIKLYIKNKTESNIKLTLSLMLLFSFSSSVLGINLVLFFAELIPIDFIKVRVIGYLYSSFGLGLSWGISDLIRIITCIGILTLLPVKNDKSIIYVCYIVGVILFFLFKSNGIIASRLTSYYKILDCIIIVDLLCCFYYRSKYGMSKKIVSIFSILFIVIYSSVVTIKNISSTPKYSHYEVNRNL